MIVIIFGFYGVQLYIVEFHHRSDLYNFPTIYDKMINEGLKISFNDIKNGDFILFNKGTRKLWYI